MTINKDANDKAVNNKDIVDKNLSRESHEKKVPVDDPSITHSSTPKDSYAGRKHEPEIDGPIQDSQETDEIYSDPRKEENLPAGGKNVGDLDAYDLSQKNNP